MKAVLFCLSTQLSNVTNFTIPVTVLLPYMCSKVVYQDVASPVINYRFIHKGITLYGFITQQF